MFNKRIAAALAGTALAASAILVPQATAIPGYYEYNGQWGTIVSHDVGLPNDYVGKEFFVPNGTSIPLPAAQGGGGGKFNSCFRDGVLKPDVIEEITVTDDDGATRQAYTLTPDCQAGTYTPPVTSTPKTTESSKPSESSSVTSTSVTSEPSESSSSSSAASTTEPTTPEEPKSSLGSSVGGAALVALSALGALGLLSSGANSSASSDESAPVAGDDSEGPATGPVAGQDAKADAQKPATGPVGGQDPKAAAQAQAANAKNVPAGTQAAPQAAAATPVAQQKQLANTGVEGTIIALAVGLIAAAAGAALLVLRRRRA